MGEYIGSYIRAHLKDGHIAKGIIENISPHANLLLLSHAEVENDLNDKSHFPRLELSADQIESIEMIEDFSSFNWERDCGEVQSASRPLPRNAKSEAAKVLPRTLPPSAAVEGIKGATKGKASTSTSQASSRNATPRKQQIKNEWMNEDVKKYKEEDFDFQGNLKLFDKKTIFDEIRAQDGTRPEERLVAHNLAQRKLRPDQMVLEKRKTQNNDEDDEILLDTLTLQSPKGKGGHKGAGNLLPPKPSSFPIPSLPTAEPTNLDPIRLKKKPRLALCKKQVPLFDSKLVDEIEQKAILTGLLSIDILVENGGKSLADFLCITEEELLTGGIILITVGSDRLAAYAITTGRHLHNRGYSVAILAPVDLRMTPGYISSALRSFQKHGGCLITAFPASDEVISVLITSSPFVLPKQLASIPCCSLVESMKGKWHIRFGLPHSLSRLDDASLTATAAATGGDEEMFVLCDIGLPTSMVNEVLGEPFYKSLFRSCPFLLIEPSII